MKIAKDKAMSKTLKTYDVLYSFWYGGTVTVLAENEDAARRKLESDEMYAELWDNTMDADFDLRVDEVREQRRPRNV